MVSGKKYRTGVTTEQIVDVAVSLTRQRGLYGWSVRDLVAEVDTSPSVVYHRVGGKDALCRRVVAHALAEPVDDKYAYRYDDANADWRDWVRAVLFPLRRTLSQYPGVAKWVLMYGPVVSENAGLDASMDHLRSAGFGEDTPRVLSLLVNTALATIMMADERKAHEDDGPRDHARLIEELRRSPNETAAEMIAFVAPFTAVGEEMEQAQDAYYQYLLNTLLDGLECSRSHRARIGDRHNSNDQT